MEPRTAGKRPQKQPASTWGIFYEDKSAGKENLSLTRTPLKSTARGVLIFAFHDFFFLRKIELVVEML